MKEFTKEELSRYNGKNGTPTYFTLKREHFVAVT
jgi:predicted heme/steroid binding protein